MIPVTLVFTGTFTFGVGFSAVGLYNIGREFAVLGPAGAIAVLSISGAGIWLTRRLAKGSVGHPSRARKSPLSLDGRAPAKAA